MLILPFLGRLASGEPSYYDVGTGKPLRLNLIIYVAVVVCSGLLAIWYLVVDGRTHLRLARPGRVDPSR